MKFIWIAYEIQLSLQAEIKLFNFRDEFIIELDVSTFSLVHPSTHSQSIHKVS